MKKRKQKKHSVKRFLCLGMLCAIMCTALFACRNNSKKEQLTEDFSAQLERMGQTEVPNDKVEEAPKPSQASSTMAAGSASGTATGAQTGTAGENVDLTEQNPEEVTIYICGAVRSPGVYALPAGARICDAVREAGGMTADAAEEYWNLAEALTDGDMIYVPTKAEAADRVVPARTSVQTDAGKSSGAIGQDGKVNINRATKEELTQIPGVGEVRAEMIIAYREEHGAFSTAYEITGVSGIGDVTYEKMKDQITVN